MKVCLNESGLCTCQCHVQLNQMFEMTGLERIPVDNPEYHPVKSPFWMPTPEDLILARAQRTAAEPVVIENKVPGVVPPTAVVQRETDDTPSGRRRQGALEDEVKRICDYQVLGLYVGIDLTPRFIAEQIDPEEPPSVGAISAVFERWVAIGFAKVEKKPTRFVGYTPDGIDKGLHVLREQAKRSKKQRQSAQMRGIKV
jgi:hypothetical protein